MATERTKLNTSYNTLQQNEVDSPPTFDWRVPASFTKEVSARLATDLVMLPFMHQRVTMGAAFGLLVLCTAAERFFFKFAVDRMTPFR